MLFLFRCVFYLSADSYAKWCALKQRKVCFFFVGQICDKNMLNFYAKILDQIIGQKTWFCDSNTTHFTWFCPVQKTALIFSVILLLFWIFTLHRYFIFNISIGDWKQKFHCFSSLRTMTDDFEIFLQVIYGIWFWWKWWEKMRFIQTNVLFFFSLYSRLRFFSLSTRSLYSHTFGSYSSLLGCIILNVQQ